MAAWLKYTCQTLTEVIRPPCSVKPPGWFIHELTAITARAGTTSPLTCAAATTTSASKRITAPSRSGKALPGLAELARHRGGRSGAVNQDPPVLLRLTGHDSRRRVSSARPCRASG